MQVCGLSLGGFGDRRGQARRSAQPDGGFFGGNGAGEGIRTLDPDLGKVVPLFCGSLYIFELSVKGPEIQASDVCVDWRWFVTLCVGVVAIWLLRLVSNQAAGRGTGYARS